MTQADNTIYHEWIIEELDLAAAAATARGRDQHIRRAEYFQRRLNAAQASLNAPDAILGWKLRRQSEVFGDWLAEVL